MDFDTDRRRFLELAGTGTALSLAGCSALQNGANSQESAQTGDGTAGGSSGGEQRVAVAAQADQQKLQQRQQEIQSELSSGNISRSEAQQQYQTAQQKLRTNAVESFRERVNSNPNLSIVNTIDEYGILLVSGTAGALIQSISFDVVNALLPKNTFQQAKSQLQQQQQAQNSTSTSTSMPSN